MSNKCMKYSQYFIQQLSTRRMSRITLVCVTATLVMVVLGYGSCWESNEDDDRFYGICECSGTDGNGTPNPCANNTGETNICGDGDSYLTCKDATCSLTNCPANQLWNQTQRACVLCKTGFHVAAEYPKCVCDKGTTFNHSSRACEACPALATVLEDSCFCNDTGATPFLFVKEWACKECPGQYVVYSRTFRDWTKRTQMVETVKVCQCPGVNDIFNRRNVSCIPCPANSKAVKVHNPADQDFCKCTIDGQMYNITANTCSCFGKFALNAEGTACVRPPKTL